MHAGLLMGTLEAVETTHYGHSCVLLDTGAARLLLDPGAFSSGFETVGGLDAVLVTHQHFDHLDTDRLGALLSANPEARLIVDSGTAGQLAGIEHEVVEPGASFEVGGARVEVLGGDHAVIHPDIPVIANNAYLIDGTHLHPGDAFTPPSAPVDVLFLPTGAPWLKVSEAVDYLRAVAPRTAVPIHEAVLSRPALHYGLFEQLGPEKTTIKVLDRETPTTV
jgi:L-ascorbate metabolism protein UlaG (beta-lactamase superfamily)